jgi:hypothetical protein
MVQGFGVPKPKKMEHLSWVWFSCGEARFADHAWLDHRKDPIVE